MFLFSIELFMHFLKRIGRNVAKGVVDLAQDGNQRVPGCAMFFDRFFYDHRDITFNCWGNHRLSMSGISSLCQDSTAMALKLQTCTQMPQRIQVASSM